MAGDAQVDRLFALAEEYRGIAVGAIADLERAETGLDEAGTELAKAVALARDAIRAHDRVLGIAEGLMRDLAASRAVLENVATWCHMGHGSHPAATCALCRPVFAELARVSR